MKTPVWQLLTTAPNLSLARAFAGLLEQQGVACQLKSGTALLGELRGCAVLVAASQLQRAKEVLGNASFSDAELEFLATGRLSCHDARE